VVSTDDRLSKHDKYLHVYETDESHPALLIPAAPILRRHLNIKYELFQAIAREYFAGNLDATDICLVTDVYVTPQLALDYRQNSSPQQTNYYVVNIQSYDGRIPDNDFEVRSSSSSLQVYGPGGPYVCWERHLRMSRFLGGGRAFNLFPDLFLNRRTIDVAPYSGGTPLVSQVARQTGHDTEEREHGVANAARALVFSNSAQATQFSERETSYSPNIGSYDNQATLFSVRSETSYATSIGGPSFSHSDQATLLSEVAKEKDYYSTQEMHGSVTNAADIGGKFSQSQQETTEDMPLKLSVNYPDFAMDILESRAVHVEEILLSSAISDFKYDVLAGYDIMPPNISCSCDDDKDFFTGTT